MKETLILAVYYFLLPLFLLISLPGYLFKMAKRGGMGTGLLERFGIYRRDDSSCRGGIYIHAVSVGETFIAIKLIREWQLHHDGPIVLAISTATGHQVAREMGLNQVRVMYAPFDLPGLPERALTRFNPQAVVLIEAELWPHFGRVCNKRSIPLLMLNARLSPRSEGRYAKIKSITRLLFAKLNAMGVQNEKDAQRFTSIGVNDEIISVTGSIKFDVLGDRITIPRPDFKERLDALRQGKAVVIAASTHAGEEALIATAIREAGAFPLIVPRHAERRDEVLQDLLQAGFKPILRTLEQSTKPCDVSGDCYVCDTTGELRDWTELAQIAIIGKSFLATGGQNPVEAIAANIPVITGPDMSNFADLVQLLQEAKGISVVAPDHLSDQITLLLKNDRLREQQCAAAYSCLKVHAGACARSVALIEQLIK